MHLPLRTPSSRPASSLERLKLAAAVLLGGLSSLTGGCAHVELEEAQAPGPAPPAAAPPPAAPPKPPEPTLKVASTPIEALRSPFFSALEFTFQNPSGKWHQVRKVSLSPERQLFGPALESLVGERLRVWQLAARDAHDAKQGPRHPALETLAPEPAPAKAEPGGAPEAAGPVGPPTYLLSGPFSVAPGLFTRKWIVLYAGAPDALLGQDLVLSYELEDGKTERVLIQYPKPEPKK
jgi:hypothetical protein